MGLGGSRGDARTRSVLIITAPRRRPLLPAFRSITYYLFRFLLSLPFLSPTLARYANGVVYTIMRSAQFVLYAVLAVALPEVSLIVLYLSIAYTDP
jgi:hypothetical protein